MRLLIYYLFLDWLERLCLQEKLVSYSVFFDWGFFIWLHWVLVVALRIFSCSMWDLAPWPGIEPGTPALGAWSLSHWTTRAVPCFIQCCSVQKTWGSGLAWNVIVLHREHKCDMFDLAQSTLLPKLYPCLFILLFSKINLLKGIIMWKKDELWGK